MSKVVLSKVSKIYSEAKHQALRSVSLLVEEGEFACIVGPSGCGKSTLLKLIAGIEQPTRGEVSRPQNVSMVFQSGALFPWLSAQENVSFGLEMTGVSKISALSTAHHYLQMVGLSNLKQSLPRDLSGGQRQRVGIARALAVSPEVLLLDEPFSALDTFTTDLLHLDLLKIWHELKMTVVMVSHSIEEAVLLADKVIVMDQGQVKKIIEVTLNRPRIIDQEDYMPVVQRIKRLFRA